MYDREVEGTTLKFLVSGLLWRRNLIMFDTETKSHWSQLLGKAMRGTKKGAELKMYPSVLTDLASWRERHPDSTVVVMAPLTLAYRPEYMTKKGPSNFVVGMSRPPNNAMAWRLDQLEYQPVLNDTFAEQPIVLTYDASRATAVIFQRTLDGTVYDFELDPAGMRDAQTGTLWDPSSGIALEGKLKGQSLRLANFVPSFYGAWQRIYRQSNYWVATPEMITAFNQRIAEQIKADAESGDSTDENPGTPPEQSSNQDKVGDPDGPDTETDKTSDDSQR